MSVEFDDDAAASLVRVAREVDGRLRDVGVLRRGAVETAAADFAGGYAKLFKAAAAIEVQDRGRLATVLDDLAAQVEVAREQARKENDRQTELADWREREAERETRRENENFFGDIGVGMDRLFDPKPSETPEAPPFIWAVFSPTERIRASGGGASSTSESSADPDHLRTFVSQARADDSGLSHEFTRLGNAWTAFTSSCSWVPLHNNTFLGGFERLLDENRSDADWIENVANAFAAAGGGALLDHALDLVATAAAPLSDQELLDELSSLPAKELAAMLAASPELKSQLMSIDPAEIHSWWTAMNPQTGTGTPFSTRQDLLLTNFPEVFGNLEGLPYTARDHANQTALKSAIADLEAQLAQKQCLLDGTEVDGGMPPFADVVKNSLLQEQLDGLHNIQKALQSPEGKATRQLITFTEDNPPLAAVSIGDLDTADSVTYAVPGMGTTSYKDMTGWTKSGQNLHDLLPPGSAVVAWIGYETPPVPGEGNVDFGVLDVNRAVAGGQNLAGALGGLAAVRGETMPQVNIVAHSYGTTTAAVTLTQPGIHVDNFITLGSAGLPDSVDSAADLNAGQVYSGHARDKIPFIESESGDQWAWTGRDFSEDHHVNPMTPGFGSHAFGTDTGGGAGRAVTDHSTHMSDDGEEAGYFDKGTESLYNTAWVIGGETEKVTPYVPLGPTDQQEIWLEGMKYAP
ncbi:alpha/beta hydrolase family protein [Arthrobacter zhaoxinii]|uniref:Alpha/beta hydrolase family protein n=1 Tax=Arthrobacter zhaoxinii TaxID=2964616 RepID=A0ABY5YRU8_9MICC|nr:alpha/beta hydrolase family protein [Arthrobacter zhaoxinii]UWX96420.1 alpha/beta hydrolase family protein [Arthrobacter zhaoxinii]